ncbi:MAG: pentapeptide repeat-containing protein [Legionellaceae bacterium]
MEKDERIYPHLCMYYPVSRQQVCDYLAYKKSHDISLNDYLSTVVLHFHVIAECHDDRLKDLDLSNGHFNEVNFSSAVLTGCNLTRTFWKKAHLTKAYFESNDLTASDFQGAFAEKSQWHKLTFTGNFSQAKLNFSLIKECKFSTNWIREGLEDEGMTLDHVEVFDPQTDVNRSFEAQILENYHANLQAKQDVDQLELHLKHQEDELEEVEERVTQCEDRISNLEALDEERIILYTQERWEDNYNTDEFRQRKARYIEPDVMLASALATKREPVWDVLNRFYDNKDKVLLIRSDTGMGKSELAELCEEDLINRYTGESCWLPIPRINLKQLDGRGNYLSAAFKIAYANEQTRRTLHEHFRCFFILDGFEESGVSEQRYFIEECLTYAAKHWPPDRQPKFLIFSQTRYLYEKFEDYHQTLRLNPSTPFPTQSEYILQPFTAEQRLAYRQLYELTDKDFLSRYAAYQAREHAVSLVEQSPFMLHMICELLKNVQGGEPLPTCHVEFYDAMLRNYYHHAQENLDIKEFTIKDVHFYLQSFALSMFEKGKFWEDRIDDEPTALVHAFQKATHTLEEDPLSFFFHNATAERISNFMPMKVEKINDKGRLIRRYTFTHPTLAYHAIAKTLLTLLLTPEGNLDTWNKRFLTDFPDVLGFLEELIVLLEKRPTGDRLFMDGLPKLQFDDIRTTVEDRLLCMVNQSKGEEGLKYQVAASNAISLLNRLRFDFSKRLPRDALRGVHIDKADLTRGLLAFMDMSESQLTKVRFRETVLMGANFRGSDLSGAQFLDASLFLYRDMVIETFSSHPFSEHTIAHDKKHKDRYMIDVVSVLNETVYTTLQGHERQILSMTWRPNGDLVTGGVGSTIRLWEMPKKGARSQEVTFFKDHVSPIVGLACSSDGQYIASIGKDNTLQIWDIQQKRRVFKDKAPSTSEGICLMWGKKKNRILLGCMDGSLHAWYFDGSQSLDFKSRCLSQATRYTMLCMAVSPDEKKLAIGCRDGFIYIHGMLKTGQLKPSPVVIHGQHYGAIHALFWHEDSIIFYAADQFIRVWNTTAERCVGLFYSQGTAVKKFEALANGRQVIAGGNQRPLFSVLDPMQSNETDLILEHNVQITHLLVVGHDLISSSITGGLFLRNVLQEAPEVKRLSSQAMGPKIRELVGSPDARYLAYLCDDGCLKFVDVAAQSEIPWALTPLTATRSFHSLCFLPCVDNDTYHLVVGASSGDAQLWRLSLSSKTVVQVLTMIHDHGSVRLAVSPAYLQTKYLAVSHGPYLKISKFSQGAFLSEPQEFLAVNETVMVLDVAWSKDGRWLASLQDDQTLNLWDTATWTCEQQFKVMSTDITLLWVLLSSGQQVLVMGSVDCTLVYDSENWSAAPLELAVGGDCYAYHQNDLIITQKKGMFVLNLSLLLSPQPGVSVFKKAYAYDLCVSGADFTQAEGLTPSMRCLLKQLHARVAPPSAPLIPLQTRILDFLGSKPEEPPAPQIELPVMGVGGVI